MSRLRKIAVVRLPSGRYDTCSTYQLTRKGELIEVFTNLNEAEHHKRALNQQSSPTS